MMALGKKAEHGGWESSIQRAGAIGVDGTLRMAEAVGTSATTSAISEIDGRRYLHLLDPPRTCAG